MKDVGGAESTGDGPWVVGGSTLRVVSIVGFIGREPAAGVAGNTASLKLLFVMAL
jgi:hypothetical protein